MSNPAQDAYGGNYPNSKRIAFARSNGKCQFCGMQRAREAHHWAWPNYPSGDNVSHADLTALCKTCHELATVMRDWVARKDANVSDLAYDLDKCNTFIAKREVFSYWLYPEEDQDNGTRTFNSDRVSAFEKAERKIGLFFLLLVVPLGLAVLTWFINVYH